ncbi:hypothetical protein QNI19_13830 [Cytophagaceae bacterium DM2B3-1]|uniref:Peptidase M61 n=1 Tax=Xanthocytophaga flava TaxID=3048013 RepID=A0ABT7CLZ3_9BACT|nr:hypothetical protein [Xanthocytophaga flavus]MDJ1494017.1 hypothetical protein [Xanthocytophaga flavus]
MYKLFLLKQAIALLCIITITGFDNLFAKPLTKLSQFEIYLKPRYDAKGIATGIEVSYTLSSTYTQSKPKLDLLFYKMEPFLQRSTDQVTNLKVYDALGQISFNKQIGVTKHDLVMQQWSALRQASGAVQVRYHVPVAIPFPAKRGPHVDLQAAGGGLSGPLGSFLLLPDPGDSVQLQLHWQLPAGHTAVSTAGMGNCTVKDSFQTVLFCQFLAGNMSVYPANAGNTGFSMYALGPTSNEIQALGDWSQKTYEQLRKRLNGSVDEPFRFLIRTYEGGPLQSGVAAHGSFLIYLPPTQSTTDPELPSLVAHEVVHAFLLGISSPTEGIDDWYNEGIADYLAIKIPFEAGLYTAKQYLELVNEESALYYTNAYREIPEKDIPAIKWSGRNTWSLGYSRGAHYFANLDAKLRKLKGDKVSVISLVNTITDLCKKGQAPNDSTWVKLLQEQAGEWAVRDWQDMINGKLLIPESDAFPELISETIKAGLFDLGFESPKNIRAGERIKGLVKGSRAEKAGLQEGDEIATTIAINPMYSSYTLPVTITVRRAGRVIPITFQPRRGQVDAIEWKPISK